MRPGTPALVISDAQREALAVLAGSQSAEHRLVQQANALLLAAEGVTNDGVAARVGVSASTVKSWRVRFAVEGLPTLGKVRAGRGRKVSIAQSVIDEIVDLTLHSVPEGETHWSCRTMALQVGVSKDTVQRVWSARGLKPHLVKTFKLSNDPLFEQKLIDVVGLYLGPRAPRGADVSSRGERASTPGLSQRTGEAGGSLSREVPVRVGAAPDNAETGQYCQMAWARQA